VILKASFDNRWRVLVDGRPATPAMFAPSLVGVAVSPGTHEVAFEYVPFPRYDLLLAAGAAAFAGLLLLEAWLTRRRSARSAFPTAPTGVEAATSGRT
jgi:hypothetical protein